VTCQILSSDSSGTDGTQIKRIDNINPSYTIYFTTTTDYVKIKFFRLSGASTNTIVNNIMLNKGSTALPYEIYTDPVFYILNSKNEYENFLPNQEIIKHISDQIATFNNGFNKSVKLKNGYFWDSTNVIHTSNH
jgi:hypothetical protein